KEIATTIFARNLLNNKNDAFSRAKTIPKIESFHNNSKLNNNNNNKNNDNNNNDNKNNNNDNKNNNNNSNNNNNNNKKANDKLIIKIDNEPLTNLSISDNNS